MRRVWTSPPKGRRCLLFANVRCELVNKLKLVTTFSFLFLLKAITLLKTYLDCHRAAFLCAGTGVSWNAWSEIVLFCLVVKMWSQFQPLNPSSPSSPSSGPRPNPAGVKAHLAEIFQLQVCLKKCYSSKTKWPYSKDHFQNQRKCHEVMTQSQMLQFELVNTLLPAWLAA